MESTDQRDVMRVVISVLWLLVCLAVPGYAGAAALSDAQIQAAIDKGRSMSMKDLNDLKYLSQGFNKKAIPISGKLITASPPRPELRMAFVADADRIAVAAGEAKRQLREFSVDDAKKISPRTVILLEASAPYAPLGPGVGRPVGVYSVDRWEWSTTGGVHMVLKIGDKIVQPLEKEGDWYSYRWKLLSPIVVARTWFTFPQVPNGIQALTITVISGTGSTKEKQVSSGTAPAQVVETSDKEDNTGMPKPIRR